MFELATTDGILLDFMIYQGNIEPTMMDPYLDRGHTLTIDNWYMTPRLADYLLHYSIKVI